MAKSKRIITNIIIMMAACVMVVSILCFTTTALYRSENDAVADMCASPRGGYITDNTTFTATDTAIKAGEYNYGFYVTNVINDVALEEDCSVGVTIKLNAAIANLVSDNIKILTRGEGYWNMNTATQTNTDGEYYFKDKNRFEKSIGIIAYYKVIVSFKQNLTAEQSKNVFTVSYSKEAAIREEYGFNSIVPVRPENGNEIIINFGDIKYQNHFSSDGNDKNMTIFIQYTDDTFFTVLALTQLDEVDYNIGIVVTENEGYEGTDINEWNVRMMNLKDGSTGNSVMVNRKLIIYVPYAKADFYDWKS